MLSYTETNITNIAMPHMLPILFLQCIAPPQIVPLLMGKLVMSVLALQLSWERGMLLCIEAMHEEICLHTFLGN